MSVVADIAQATGLPERTVRAELNRAALADTVVLILAARLVRPGVTPEKAAEIAGLSKAEISAAVLRHHDRLHREQRATMIAYQRAQADAPPTPKRTHQRHLPVGDPPDEEHRWCKRGSHWVHQDDMGRNRAFKEGYADWCRPCWRDYWHTKVKPRKARNAAATG